MDEEKGKYLKKLKDLFVEESIEEFEKAFQDENVRTSLDPTCTIEYDIDTGVKEDDILEEDGKIYKVYYALGKIDKVLKKGFKLNEYGSEISYNPITKKYIVCCKEDNECIEYDRISGLLRPGR
ncbi:hypothetical protein M2325_000700 [Methanococcus voltae PS]|uniref:Uncharacterized protein n=1 Tax=Methanococcus voltae PS TaxID=523842 RepID=A0ABT2EYL4_METVO|nr:hypothetical protein [Methanococcus voltae]MCS3922015.1 hypothetical protein [Methanococcus voltae PS]